MSVKRKRCPNGSRRSKKSGKCEPYIRKQYPNGSRRSDEKPKFFKLYRLGDEKPSFFKMPKYKLLEGPEPEPEIFQDEEPELFQDEISCDECKTSLRNSGISDITSFRKWAAKNHPDRGGNLNTFQFVSRCVDKYFKNKECGEF